MDDALTLQSLIDEEAAKTRSAQETYGEAFDITQSALELFSSAIVGIDGKNFLAASLIISMQKSAVLSFLSHIRAHTAQAEFNARQLIEFCVLAAYDLAHPDEELTRINEDGLEELKPSQQVSSKAYKWLDAEFANTSNLLKEAKAQINEVMSHANHYLTHFTFDMAASQAHTGVFRGHFFDNRRDDVGKLYLVSNAKLILLCLDTLRQVAQVYGGLSLIDDIAERVRDLNIRAQGEAVALALRLRSRD